MTVILTIFLQRDYFYFLSSLSSSYIFIILLVFYVVDYTSLIYYIKFIIVIKNILKNSISFNYTK